MFVVVNVKNPWLTVFSFCPQVSIELQRRWTLAPYSKSDSDPDSESNSESDSDPDSDPDSESDSEWA